MRNHKKLGFTLIELLLAMVLVSLIAVACIWVFQQSLEISNRSVGRADVNKSFRVVQDRLRKDLVDCLPLVSEMQHFIMISRYQDNENFNKAFPADFLSFATTTYIQPTVSEDLVLGLGFVSYDLVGTTLYRYVSGEYDWVNGPEQLAKTQPQGTKDWPSFSREIVVENCVEFKVEYLWKDERPLEVKGGNAVLPSANTWNKQFPDPGVFLTLHPYVNENKLGRGFGSGSQVTGGLNGSPLVMADSSTAYAGTASYVGEQFYNSPIFGHQPTGVPREVLVPHHKSSGVYFGTGHSVSEPHRGVPMGFNGSETAVAAPSLTTPDPKGVYQRVIHIRSPNLYRFHENFKMSENGDRTYDITANYGNTVAYPSSSLPSDAPDNWVVTHANVSVGEHAKYFFDYYEKENEDSSNKSLLHGKGTFVPAQLRITMKIHNGDRTVLSTNSFIFHIPHSGR